MAKNYPLDYLAIQQYFSSSRKVVITTHRSPDGDAIGSSLGLAHFLTKEGHQVHVIVPDPFPAFLSWMDGSDEILIYESQIEVADRYFKEAEVVFCLDYNRLDRVGDMGKAIRAVEAKTILIDHHIDPDQHFDHILSDTKASSTSELIYRFASEMQWLKHLNQSISEALYAGIMTDTGSFKFSSTSAETHRIAAHLMEAGLVPEKVHSEIFDTNSFDRLQLIGYALSKKLAVDVERGISIIPLSLAEKNRFHYQRGDTEGLVNYGLSIKGTKMAVFLSEELDFTKFSFRSKGAVDVNMIARSHFNGGGHKNAAGGKLDMKLPEALTYLHDVIENKLTF